MKILVQWATTSPESWRVYDSADWASLPTRPDPDSSSVLDTGLGWVNRLCVQGMEFTADHYAVESIRHGGCRVYTWSNAPARDGRPGYEEGTRYARVWEFYPLAPDSRFGGAYNTKQTQHVYAEDSVLGHYQQIGTPANTTLRPWSEFTPPDHIAKHGVWIPDETYAQLEAIRPTCSWREWTEHLPSTEKDQHGRLLDQRGKFTRYDVPKGTRTYYHNPVTLVTGTHAADVENALENSPSGVATNQESQNLSGNEDILGWVASSPPNEPDQAQWPTGEYRAQLDVVSIGGDITFGLLTLGTSPGHFARVSADLSTELETKEQIQAAFAGSGLHLATTGSVSWAAGNQDDRFEIAIAAVRASNHGNQTITLQLGEADDFADGPWPSAQAPVEANAPFFGTNA